MDAEDRIRQLILPRLQKVRRANGAWTACCPAHEDGNPSLSVGVGDAKGKPVLHCHAGCDPDAILDALNLTWEQLRPGDDDLAVKPEWTPHGEAVAVYDYTDEDGKLLFQVLRTADKQFPQRVPDRARPSGWRWSLGKTRRVLYRLPKVIEGIKAGEIIYVTEGEKDVHSMERAGVVATCNPGGCGAGWRDEYTEFLRDAIVIIVADADAAGQKHARRVAAALEGTALSVEISEPAHGKDVTDHLNAGLTLADLVITKDAGEEAKPDLAPDLYEFISIVDPPYDWVIEGLLERGDRLIWTGFEGLGKSVVLRQLAVSASAGVHPFNGEILEPRRVLFIDCENPDRKSRRHFRKLEEIARNKGFPVPKGMLRILQHPEGVDLTTDDGAAWLLERVTAHKPELLVVGPFYRLHETDANEELGARQVVKALDAARIKADCALVTEAHAGHGDSARDRSVRPAGSSLLLRWPEFGYGIKPRGDADDNGHHHDAIVVPWRGPREERHWPRRLTWGVSKTDWPWIPDLRKD